MSGIDAIVQNTLACVMFVLSAAALVSWAWRWRRLDWWDRAALVVLAAVLGGAVAWTAGVPMPWWPWAPLPALGFGLVWAARTLVTLRRESAEARERAARFDAMLRKAGLR